MKKLLFSVLLMFLPMMAMGQTNQGAVIAEADFTTATEFTNWSQFADEQIDGKVELQTGEGLVITVGVQTGQLWQPQIMVIPDGSFDLLEDGKYKVVLTAKFPSAGTLQLNMGSWSSNYQETFPIAASDDFQTIECDFESWPCDIEDAHLLFMCGDFKGKTILKKIQVLDMEGGVSVSDIAYNFISKGKIAEVIHKNYKEEVVIPSTVMYDGIEYTVTKIADNAFHNCTKLTSVTIPSSVTSIGSYAFYGCTKLTSVTVPSSVTSIGNNAFEGCNGLNYVQISDLKTWCNISFNNNPLSYAHHLFMNGQEVKNLVIPSGVTSIGSNAFSGCSGLTSVTIPNNVTTIGSSAFNKCSGLTSVIIPNSISSIGESVFANCSGLTSVTIPTSVTSIGWQAFQNCTGLTSVSISNNVTTIGSSAFSGCTGLTSMTIPNSVTTIGSSAFFICIQRSQNNHKQ